MNTVCATHLASRLRAMRNGEDSSLQDAMESEPRILEALWFIQARSHEQGGVKALTEELIAKFPQSVGHRVLYGRPGGSWPLDQALEVWHRLSTLAQREMTEFAEWASLNLDDQLTAAKVKK